MDEGEPAVPGAGELVVNDHLDPGPVLPELETEEAAVTSLLAEALASDQHLVQGPGLRGQAGEGGQQPAVPQLALDDIKLGFSSQVRHSFIIRSHLIHPVHHQPRVLGNLVRPEPLHLVTRHKA